MIKLLLVIFINIVIIFIVIKVVIITTFIITIRCHSNKIIVSSLTFVQLSFFLPNLTEVPRGHDGTRQRWLSS